ncbi:pyrroloquinoline quinone biosynthesis protein PqqF [Pseudomonas sp. SH1-B]
MLQQALATAHSKRLANGAELRVLQQSWAQDVGVCLRVAAGSHDEPEAYPGLAHFLEHLLFLGSRDYPREQSLMAFAQRLGGQVNASTQARHTDFVCQVPAEQLQPALLRLLDMLAWPLLEVEAQLREREVLHAEYQARSQDGDSRIDHALGQALAAGHRCGDFLAGDRGTLAVERPEFQQALHDYHRQHYRAANMCLTLVGPQPPEQLLAMAGELLGAWPATEPEPVRPPAALLPLRASRLNLPQDANSLHVGFAAQVDEGALDAALELLLDALHDPACGGLLDGLRARQLGRQLQARLLYCHAGQCFLRLDFPGADGEQGPRLRAALQSWARQMQGHAHWRLRLRQWQQTLTLRQLSLAPLALARHLQTGTSDAASTLSALDALLSQLADGKGLIELHCSQREQPLWPATGLALPLQALAEPDSALTCDFDFRLATEEPLLAASAVLTADSLPPARVRHYPGQGAAGPAALYWRGPCTSTGASDGIEASLQARLADLRWRGERLGIACQLSVQPGRWTLLLQGPAALLPAFSALLVAQLLAPVVEPAQPASQGMLLRSLLHHLPTLCPCSDDATLQALSVGLGEAERVQLDELCLALEPLDDLPGAPAGYTGLTWHQHAQPAGDAALLLFCPLPAAHAHTEAAWRLLGQQLQGRFYQRLRGELQLGYALFAGFRQVQGCRGLLFALQSPLCNAAGIFAHIRGFLDEQRQALAALDDAELAAGRAALQMALTPATANLPRAEQLWQLYLAGLPEVHPQRLQQALAVLTRDDLLDAHRQLLDVSDWRVLASDAPSPL